MLLRRCVAFAALAASLSALPLASHAGNAEPSRAGEGPSVRLADAPAVSETWTIFGPEARFGRSRRWIAPDGTRWSRDSFEERGYRLELDQQLRFTREGELGELVIRGFSSSGDKSEAFSARDGNYTFRSPIDHGGGPLRPNTIYVPFSGTLDATWMLVEALLKAPDHKLDLLPSGRASMERLATLEVSNGKATKTLTLQAITGLGLSPQPVWLDGERVFGMVGAISFLPENWEMVAGALTRAQEAALAQQASAILSRAAHRPKHPIIFTDVQIYDAEARIFRPHMSVVVSDGMITDVGPARTTRAPAGAQVIAGSGRTLIPGLWDSHKHYGDDATGVQLLSQGITTIRDLGTVPDTLTRIRRGIDTGELLGPRIVPLLMIDGPGPQADHVAVIVSNEQEARAAVRKAVAEGYAGIKIYGSLDPALIAPVAADARRAGLRVQGHLPRTVRSLAAVRAGFSELTHINFVLMQAMPDSVVNATKGLEQRHYGPMRFAPQVDLRAPSFSSYLDELARRGTAVDPTLATFEKLWTSDAGKVPPAYIPFAGVLPPQFERDLKGGGLAPLTDLSRPAMRRAFNVAIKLVGEIHRRGIPILAGSDGFGFELIRELELYVAAGLSPADALATATIVPARAMGLERQTGSIAVGKRAELVLVAGNPGREISDLRRVELVMRAGLLMRGDDLRQAAGLTGEPH